LIHTDPARRPFASRCAFDTSRVHTPLPSPKGRSVAAANHFLDIGKRDRRNHRTKDLLLGDAHVVADIGKHGRRDKIALCERTLSQLLAAGHRASAFLPPDTQIAGDALELLLGDERADLGVGIDAIANLQTLAELSDTADEFVIDLAFSKEPCTGAADLARIGKNCHAGTRHRHIEIGIGKNHIGRFAAELERDPLQVPGGSLNNQLTGQVRAGEGDLVDSGMSGQCGAGGLAVAGNDVDDTRRHTCFEKQLA
jgi:hypothetical protein